MKDLQNVLKKGDVATLWVRGNLNYNGVGLLRVYAGQVVASVEDDTVYFRDVRPEVSKALNAKYKEGQVDYELWKRNGKSS